jgi:hypothetical protein
MLTEFVTAFLAAFLTAFLSQVSSPGPPSPVPTELNVDSPPPTPTTHLLTLSLHGIKVRDFAFDPHAHTCVSPAATTFRPLYTIAVYDDILRKFPRTRPIPGRALRRLLDIGWVTEEVGSWEEMDWKALRNYDAERSRLPSRPDIPIRCQKPTMEERDRDREERRRAREEERKEREREEREWQKREREKRAREKREREKREREGKRKMARSQGEQPNYVVSVAPPPPVLPPLDKGKKRAFDHDPEVNALLDTSADARPHSPKRSRASPHKPPDAPQHVPQAIPSITVLSGRFTRSSDLPTAKTDTSILAKKRSDTTIATRVSKRAASPDAPVHTRLKRTRKELALDPEPKVRTVRRSRSTTTKAATTAAATTTSRAKRFTIDGPALKPKAKSRSCARAPAVAATVDDNEPASKPKRKTKTKTKPT